MDRHQILTTLSKNTLMLFDVQKLFSETENKRLEKKTFKIEKSKIA